MRPFKAAMRPCVKLNPGVDLVTSRQKSNVRWFMRKGQTCNLPGHTGFLINADQIENPAAWPFCILVQAVGSGGKS